MQGPQPRTMMSTLWTFTKPGLHCNCCLTWPLWTEEILERKRDSITWMSFERAKAGVMNANDPPCVWKVLVKANHTLQPAPVHHLTVSYLWAAFINSKQAGHLTYSGKTCSYTARYQELTWMMGNLQQNKTERSKTGYEGRLAPSSKLWALIKLSRSDQIRLCLRCT